MSLMVEENATRQNRGAVAVNASTVVARFGRSRNIKTLCRPSAREVDEFSRCSAVKKAR